MEDHSHGSSRSESDPIDGEVSWACAETEFIRVKGVIRDRAGNEASQERVVEFAVRPQGLASISTNAPASRMSAYAQGHYHSSVKTPNEPARTRWSSHRGPYEPPNLRRPLAANQQPSNQQRPSNSADRRSSNDGFPDYDPSMFEDDYEGEYQFDAMTDLHRAADPVVGDFGRQVEDPPTNRRKDARRSAESQRQPTRQANGVDAFTTNSLQFNLDYEVNEAESGFASGTLDYDRSRSKRGSH